MSRLSNREKLFIKFASVELDGSLYMTPEDFLESVIKAEPRRKLTLKGSFIISNLNLFFNSTLETKILK